MPLNKTKQIAEQTILF